MNIELNRKKSSRRKRQKNLHCRVSPAEYEQIAARAEASGNSVSALLRCAALGQKIERPLKVVPGPTLEELARLMGQLGIVGSTLQQLARGANSTACPAEGPKLDEALDTLRALQTRIWELLP